MADFFCSNCGASMSEEDAFCAKCGTPTPQALVESSEATLTTDRLAATSRGPAPGAAPEPEAVAPTTPPPPARETPPRAQAGESDTATALPVTAGWGSSSNTKAVVDSQGFLSSLFDYSFSNFVTSKIVKVLYVLTTIMAVLWTILLIVAAFNASSTFGVLTLLIIGPFFFLLTMTYARVVLEVLIVLFRISENVSAIAGRVPQARAEGSDGGTV
jgi:hypothetical protein